MVHNGFFIVAIWEMPQKQHLLRLRKSVTQYVVCNFGVLIPTKTQKSFCQDKLTMFRGVQLVQIQ